MEIKFKTSWLDMLSNAAIFGYWRLKRDSFEQIPEALPKLLLFEFASQEIKTYATYIIDQHKSTTEFKISQI